MRPALFEMSSGARTCLKVSVFEYLAAIRYKCSHVGIQFLDAKDISKVLQGRSAYRTSKQGATKTIRIGYVEGRFRHVGTCRTHA